MKTLSVLLAGPLTLALAFTPSLAAAAPAAAYQEDGSLAEVEALEASYNEAMSEYRKLSQQAKSDEERQKAYETAYPDAAQFAADFLDLAAEYPGTAAAEKALVWVVTRTRDDESIEKSLGMLLANHIESEELGTACGALGRSVTGTAEAFLQTVLEKSPHRDVRGNACFTLGSLFKSQADLARTVNTDEETRERYAGFYGEANVARLAKMAPDDLLAKAEKQFERVTKDFADVAGRRGTIGKAAEGQLFEIRNLAIGKEAPEIEGEDVDGVVFKLSDYRGKVVVIDFWGDW